MSIDKSSYVSKDKLRVRIHTQRESIRGFVHVLYRHRASDLLNDASRFIPVTDAVIVPLGAEGPANNVPFLAINKDHIVSLFEEPGEVNS